MTPGLEQAIAEHESEIAAENARRSKAWNECDPYDLREIERSHKEIQK